MLNNFPENREKGLPPFNGIMMVYDSNTGIPVSVMDASYEMCIRDSMQTGHFNDFLMPLYQGPACNAGSTDVGDVSYQCPTAQIHVAVWPNHVPCHSWQVVSCNKTLNKRNTMIFHNKMYLGNYYVVKSTKLIDK